MPKDGNIKLSVIIPCYNGEDYIAEQLEALLGQQWSEPWEVIFVDNRSTDNSMAIVKSYEKRLSNLRIVDASTKLGQPYALNSGANASKAESLLFVDADDVVGVGYVKEMGEALKKNEFVAAQFDYEKINPLWTLKYRSNGQKDDIQQYTNPPFLPHAGGGSLGVKRKIYQDVGGFDEAFPALHDTDFCWKIQLSGIKLQFVQHAVLHVRLRNTLKGIYRQTNSYGEYNVKLYKKYRKMGMPKISREIGFKKWKKLIRSLPKLRQTERRPIIINQLGWRIGRLKGCIKYRTIAL